MDIQVAAAVVAVTEIVKRLAPDQVKGIAIIVVAGVLGGLAGLAEINGLDLTSGIFVGLAAAGVVKVGQVVGGK